MRVLLSCIILLIAFTSFAQRADTLTREQWDSKDMTAESLLRIPSSIYTVLCCDIIINLNNGSLIKVWYAKDGSRYCINANSSDFARLWSEQVAHRSGTKVTMDDIIIRKGEKEMKLQSQSFITP